MEKIDLKKIDALIFDLDGTLIDSMPVHNRSWMDTVAKRGLEITVEFLQELAGISTPKTIEIYNRRFGHSLDPQEIAREKEERYLQNIESVAPAKPVLDIVEENFQKKSMAIVTGGQKKVVNKILKTLDLNKYFPVVVCAEDTEKSKEFPDPFLLAAGQLKADPGKCLVFEDGEVGIKGAKAAGMKVVKVDLRSKAVFTGL